MTAMLITNVMIWDGTGRDAYRGEITVEGERIESIAEADEKLPRDGMAVVDGGGATLMPGLVEGHAHISYRGRETTFADLGAIPAEEQTLISMHNARTLLDAGFTSAYSGAAAKMRVDVVIRNEIESGRIPGPRLRAASPEITNTSGLGDIRQSHQYRDSVVLFADGPEEMRRVCRECIREGVDQIKINVSGDNFVLGARGERTIMFEDEIAEAVSVARSHGAMINAHARTAEGVKRAVKGGVDVIYHADYCDEEALDLLEEAKDRVFLGPAIGFTYGAAHEAEAWGMTRAVVEEKGLFERIESGCRVYDEARKRGIRVVIGGDYGFPWTPQGAQARDLEHFVNLFGYSPTFALQCATKVGGELMGRGDEIGQIHPGYLADLLLVTGDPTVDVRILKDQSNIVGVMKGGSFHRTPDPGIGALKDRRAA
jgi:imidazolonepropionase-like amidohydrolase